MEEQVFQSNQVIHVLDVAKLIIGIMAGYMKEHHLLPDFTALENVIIPGLIMGKSRNECEKRAKELLGIFGLMQRTTHFPTELSGGERQRVALARALFNEPAILLADEPTGNLDSIKSLEIMDLLKQLNKESNITIIMVTHEEEMASYASRTIYFRDGHIEDSLKKGFKYVESAPLVRSSYHSEKIL